MNRVIGAVLPWLMARSLRHALAGIWGRSAPLPERGAVLVANHHSWWDGYLLWWTIRRAGRRVGMLIDARTLARFPFFRHVGGIAPSEARAAARKVARGDWLVVFPEGALTPHDRLEPFARGAQAISRWAGEPIVPIGVRVVMRARQRPEAYLRIGEALDANTPAHLQHAAVSSLLGAIDADVAHAADAEAPLAGYEAWLEGAPSTDERASRSRWWWSR